MDTVTATLAISRLGERWLNMKKTIAIFVSLDLYRYDLVLPTPAIRGAADGQLAVAESGKA